MPRTWFITGAGRGLGTEIAKAALKAGDNVVATARKRAALSEALGPDGDRLLSVALDVTDRSAAERAVAAALQRFGAIDVLVNNAGYGHLALFEEATPEDVKTQFDTNLYGFFNVTWAALPAMRTRRQGRIFNLSSIGGLRSQAGGGLYSATKFAMEGVSEALADELAPFGIFVTIVEPGPFRTDFLAPDSIRFGGQPIADYAERRAALRQAFESRNGKQPGDPKKLAEAMVQLAGEAEPPLRFLAGAMAVETATTKLKGMLAEFERWRALSLATDYDA